VNAVSAVSVSRTLRQRQAPLTHLPSQTAPQEPQLASSFFTFTQLPAPASSEQSSNPPGQPQTPSEQVWPCGQRRPQPPQLAGLEVVFVHSGGAPHASVLGGHTQAPPLQRVPPVQATPQEPQLFTSEAVSTQAPAQSVSPAAQVSAHADCEQT